MLRLLVADSQAAVRRGVVELLADELKSVVIAEASSAGETLALVASDRWDLLILHISAAGRFNVDLLKQLTALRPLLPVLALSDHSDEEAAARFIRAGGAGHVATDQLPDRLAAAVLSIVGEGNDGSPDSIRRTACSFRAEPDLIARSRP